MKVKAKNSNRFLTKDEWYEVLCIRTTEEFNDNSRLAEFECEATPISIRYELVNHTSKRWATSWYHETNFYTVQEIRDNKIDQIIQNQPEKNFPI